MPKQSSDIVAQMRAGLAITEPDLDTSVGSPVRKILDAVGEVIGEAYSDQYLLSYQYDIDSKSGSDLDDMVALFGFSRLPATRASGTVTFERPANPSVGSLLLPVGTQVATSDAPPITFATTSAVVLGAEATTVEVPVQAVLGGPQGNVSANAIHQWVTPVAGITSFSNVLGTSGGTAAETDDQLRSRFKKTVFRGLTGTESMFIGLALEDTDVTRVNVVGASKRRHEQIQIVNGFGASTVQDAAYVYPRSVIFGRDLQSGDIFSNGVHYLFNPLGGPSITAINSTVLPDGIYQLEFEYAPLASRNDPANGITNRIDIFVNGMREVQATETLLWSTARVFSSTPTDQYYTGSFIREDGTPARSGNYFIPYSFAPVVDPASDSSLAGGLVINSTTYQRGIDFFLVNNISKFGGAPRSASGIEFISAANTPPHANPPNNTPFSATYRYNEIPTAIESSIARWRLVTTDARVHQAQFVRLNLYLAVIYNENFVQATVNTAIQTAVATFVNQVNFDEALQVSDLLAVVHAVAGVDAVRFLTSADDPVHYALQRIADDGTTVMKVYSIDFSNTGVLRATDVVLADNQVPVLNSISIVPKAQNTFNAGI